MRIHLLCEGNPETKDSWSGITLSVLRELRRTGHVVDWTDVDLVGWSRLVAAASTFSINPRRWRSRYHLAAVPFLLRSGRARAGLSRRPKPDVVLQIGATFRPSRSDVPVVFYCDSNILLAQHGRETGHGDAAPLSEREVAAIEDRERALYESAAEIMTLSNRVAESFISDFGIPRERVHTVHGGPNLEIRLNDGPREPKRTVGPPTVLFVGRQFLRKGGDLLLRSFLKVRRAIPNARLLIVGPETLGDAEQVEQVELLGFLRPDDPTARARLEQAYEDADVFCLPTRFEAFGIVFLEAMHRGLPCIGPRAWAVPEMITDGVTGFLVPPEDEDALAARLIELLSDPSKARRMGEAGRRRAREYFTWPATVERINNVMEGVKRP